MHSHAEVSLCRIHVQHVSEANRSLKFSVKNIYKVFYRMAEKSQTKKERSEARRQSIASIYSNGTGSGKQKVKIAARERGKLRHQSSLYFWIFHKSDTPISRGKIFLNNHNSILLLILIENLSELMVSKTQNLLQKVAFSIYLRLYSSKNINLLLLNFVYICYFSQTGPGPGRYGLPSTVGYVKHDFTKHMKPSYSLAARLENSSKYSNHFANM